MLVNLPITINKVLKRIFADLTNKNVEYSIENDEAYNEVLKHKNNKVLFLYMSSRDDVITICFRYSKTSGDDDILFSIKCNTTEIPDMFPYTLKLFKYSGYNGEKLAFFASNIKVTAEVIPTDIIGRFKIIYYYADDNLCLSTFFINIDKIGDYLFMYDDIKNEVKTAMSAIKIPKKNRKILGVVLSHKEGKVFLEGNNYAELNGERNPFPDPLSYIIEDPSALSDYKAFLKDKNTIFIRTYEESIYLNIDFLLEYGFLQSDEGIKLNLRYLFSFSNARFSKDIPLESIIKFHPSIADKIKELGVMLQLN